MCKSEKVGSDDEFLLLLDFFTFSDYIRFREVVVSRFNRDIENRGWPVEGMPRH